jgi:hypothetical protein
VLSSSDMFYQATAWLAGYTRNDGGSSVNGDGPAHVWTKIPPPPPPSPPPPSPPPPSPPPSPPPPSPPPPSPPLNSSSSYPFRRIGLSIAAGVVFVLGLM